MGSSGALSKRSRRKKPLPRCHSGQINQDDGVDPRYYFAASSRENRDHRKAAQLCRQVADTLHYTLHGDNSSELLSSLMVVSVHPAPDTARLLVMVQSDLPSGSFRPDEAIAVLNSQTGRLRSEIARSINRKKTPQLMFQMVFVNPDQSTGRPVDTNQSDLPR